MRPHPATPWARTQNKASANRRSRVQIDSDPPLGLEQDLLRLVGLTPKVLALKDDVQVLRCVRSDLSVQQQCEEAVSVPADLWSNAKPNLRVLVCEEDGQLPGALAPQARHAEQIHNAEVLEVG
jgi:hypothetical protein